MAQTANPLKQFFRQPAIYMRLPSAGEYWPDGSISMPENKELPVYPMTAIDEITYRTPDALFNGQAVVNVIKSCVPAITDAWAIPAQDLNAILVAIRIASYGHDLEVGTRCPACETEGEYTLDLRQVLDQLKSGDYETPMVHGDLTIAFQPMSYRGQNDSSQSQFEQQKNIQLIQQSDIPDEEKIAQLNNSLQKITQLTMSALKWSIASIKTPTALVTEPEFIEEFIKNCDRKLYTKIRDHIIGLRMASELKPLAIKCDNCSHEYQQQFNLDQTAFFEVAS
jgi:hypothetical protein